MFLEQQNHHIRMISEGSCDTEDWSNDAEISSLHHRYNLDFKRYSNKKIDLIGEQNKWKSYQPQTFKRYCKIVKIKS